MCIYMLTDTHRPSGYRYLQGLAADPSVHPGHISAIREGSTEEVHSPARLGLDLGLSPACFSRMLWGAGGPHSFPVTILVAAWAGWQGLQ